MSNNANTRSIFKKIVSVVFSSKPAQAADTAVVQYTSRGVGFVYIDRLGHHVNKTA